MVAGGFLLGLQAQEAWRMADAETVYDVAENEFEERVIRASSRHPVVVDFWAPWCAPCRMLGPTLEKVVASLKGSVTLAKVNVDHAPGAASRYGIQGIPAVKVFRDGKAIAEFVGLRGELEIRQMLSGLAPSEADRIVAVAAKLAAAGRLDEAAERYQMALDKTQSHAGALLGLASLAMKRGDLKEARDVALSIQPEAPEYEDAHKLLARVEFLAECAKQGGKEAAQRAAEAQPQDLDSTFGLAVCLAAQGNYEQALERLLAVVQSDKAYRDGAAKEAMVRIFSIIGQRSELADDFRSKLSQAVY